MNIIGYYKVLFRIGFESDWGLQKKGICINLWMLFLLVGMANQRPVVALGGPVRNPGSSNISGG